MACTVPWRSGTVASYLSCCILQQAIPGATRTTRFFLFSYAAILTPITPLSDPLADIQYRLTARVSAPSQKTAQYNAWAQAFGISEREWSILQLQTLALEAAYDSALILIHQPPLHY